MLIRNNVMRKICFSKRKYFFIDDDTMYGHNAQVTNVIYVEDICLVKK